MLLPTELRQELLQHGVAIDDLAEQGKYGVPRPVRRWCTRPPGSGADAGAHRRIVVELASSDHGRLRLARELHGRRWAEQHGIPTAAVYAAADDGRWLVGDWLSEADSANQSYLESALDAALRIAAAPEPPPGPPPAVWRSSGWARVVRSCRGLLSGPPVAQWWRARRAVAELPRVPVSHGDFYHRNVPMRAGQACVVDWEYLGAGPRYADLMRMWTILPTRESRDRWLALVLQEVPAADHGTLGLLGRWLTLRLIGENVKAPAAHRNAADTAHARAMLPEAKALADTLSPLSGRLARTPPG